MDRRRSNGILRKVVDISEILREILAGQLVVRVPILPFRRDLSRGMGLLVVHLLYQKKIEVQNCCSVVHIGILITL